MALFLHLHPFGILVTPLHRSRRGAVQINIWCMPASFNRMYEDLPFELIKSSYSRLREAVFLLQPLIWVWHVLSKHNYAHENNQVTVIQYCANNTWLSKITANFPAFAHVSGWLYLSILPSRWMQLKWILVLRVGGIGQRLTYSCYEQHGEVDQNHGCLYNC